MMVNGKKRKCMARGDSLTLAKRYTTVNSSITRPLGMEPSSEILEKSMRAIGKTINHMVRANKA